MRIYPEGIPRAKCLIERLKRLLEVRCKDLTVCKQLRSIFESVELVKEATLRKFRTVQTEGGRAVSRNGDFFYVDTNIPVGCRVKFG